MTHPSERLEQVSDALARLATDSFVEGARGLLGTLGYSSPKTLDTGGKPSVLLDAIGIDGQRFESFAGVEAWQSLDVLFQLTGEELPPLARGSTPATSDAYQNSDIDSFVFLAIDLRDRSWTRRELVGITRELNRGFAMPAIVLFRHLGRITLSVIDRRRNMRDASRDVVGGRISLIKDIDLARPHRAHLSILSDLTFSSLRPGPADFRGLYNGWLGVLSASELNKRFYKELADWFAWASGEGVVHFPPGQGNADGERQIGIIRLLTRLMFVWFVKQKDLVPGDFFEEQALSEILKEAPHGNPDGHNYYLAILQNLFFACLNTEMDERGWLPRGATGAMAAYLDHSKLRYQALFADPAAALAKFGLVPFLNGGLFDCLDVEIKANNPNWRKGTQERHGRVLRIDGFSEETDHQPLLPNRLFFGGQPDADLSAYYGKRTIRRAPGLIDLFNSYKFTVEENTPLEEETALDPELLGKVFENLLASYNEDTKTTARNKSGSFYTPREVVDFMVDEALVAYLAPVLAPSQSGGLRPTLPKLDVGQAPSKPTLKLPPLGELPAPGEGITEARLRDLLGYAAEVPAFSDEEANALVAAIERCRAIDPAVGSGAFPLGLLQKLVHVLSRLDPGGIKWKMANRAPYLKQIETARTIKSPTDRAVEEQRARERLAAFDAAWPEGSHAEYARKLYLIEGCLHGVDIQPIAVQIAKLRCFIALAVEQQVANDRPNRGILALPNLELKFVAANALGLVGRAQTVLTSDETRSIEADWRDTAQQLFSARDRRTKRSLKKHFEDLREKLASSLVADGMPEGEAALMARWDPFDSNSAAGFFSPEWMFGLGDHDGGCFDIALANPPYVRQEKIESYLLDGRPANLKQRLAMDYATATGTADLLVYFFERAVRLLRPGGVVAFITSNKWYRAGYGAKLRAWLSAETRLRTVIDFGDAEVFEAIAYPTIVVAQKRMVRRAPDSTETFRALNWSRGDAPDGFPARFAKEAFTLKQADLSGGADWQLLPPNKGNLVAQIRDSGRPLKELLTSEIYRGITTGYNPAFELDENDREGLMRDRSAELIKPLVRGRTLQKWVNKQPDQWILFSRRGIDISSYPAAKSHLKGFRSNLEPKPKNHVGPWVGRKSGSYQWWEIQDNVAYWPVFEKPKIISNKVTDKPNFSYDNENLYLANTAYCFTCLHDKLVLGVLNSSLSSYISRRIFVDKEGGFYEVQPDSLATFPIPYATSEQEAVFAVAVDALLAGAQPRAPLESLINAFVYELFFPAYVKEAGSPILAARDAGLLTLASLSGPDLAQAAEGWARRLAEPESTLHRTLFALQSLEPIRIIEGRI